MLADLMKRLINGEVIVIERNKNDEVTREIFIEDGQFKLNTLSRSDSDDPYDQETIGDGEALALIDDYLIS